MAEIYTLVDFPALQALTDLFGIQFGKAWHVRPGVLSVSLLDREPVDSSLFPVKGQNGQSTAETSDWLSDFKVGDGSRYSVDTCIFNRHCHRSLRMPKAKEQESDSATDNSSLEKLSNPVSLYQRVATFQSVLCLLGTPSAPTTKSPSYRLPSLVFTRTRDLGCSMLMTSFLTCTLVLSFKRL